MGVLGPTARNKAKARPPYYYNLRISSGFEIQTSTKGQPKDQNSIIKHLSLHSHIASAGTAKAFIATPKETQHGTRPGGRGPGGVPGGVGSKNRGRHVRVHRGGSIRIQMGVYPYSHFVCLNSNSN